MVFPGTIMGEKYKIICELGRGGMSIVYLALDVRLDKKWAVKEIKLSGQRTEAVIQSFRSELDVLKRVDHPVLPRIVDVIYEADRVYLVMDYVEGNTLEEVVKERGPQPQEAVVVWAAALCDGLQYLHDMGIVYRDMKPSNIILKPDGAVKMVDLGAAVEGLRDENVYAVGTKGYAAPEQFGDSSGIQNKAVDARTDIYSLGVTIYYMLTGAELFRVPYEIWQIPDRDNRYSDGLHRIILRCVETDPAKRYQSMEELKLHLINYRKLERMHQRACLRGIRQFLAACVLSLCFLTVAFSGYVGICRERNLNYDDLMSRGRAYVLQKKYDEALEAYRQAVNEVDGFREDAYLEILKIYIDYNNDPETGLRWVREYIDRNYRHVGENQSLVFQMALYYFERLQDYRESAYFFEMLDTKQYPEAEYYLAAVSMLTEVNVDYEAFMERMEQFEKMNEELPISLRRLQNDRILCEVYAQCIMRLDEAADDLKRAAERGLSCLEEYEDASVKADYYIVFNRYLALAYEQLGDGLAQRDMDGAHSYYEAAIGCCNSILDLVSGEDADYERSRQLREAKYCQKAELYAKLGQYEQACAVYEQAENEFGSNGISIYVGHLTLLCELEEQVTPDVELWDYDKLKQLYEKGLEISGIEQDFRWKRLTVKLAPLFAGRED